MLGSRKKRAAVLGLLITALAAWPAHAADKECLKKLYDTAAAEHKRTELYLAEMKNMKEDPFAPRSVSACNGAVGRADQYMKKNVADESVCTTGSTYVDSQVVQLFRNASSTCRSEIQRLAQRMPADDQQRLTQRIAQKEAEIH